MSRSETKTVSTTASPLYNEYRFKAYYDAIKAKYPGMTIIGSTTDMKNQSSDAATDFHQYATPDKDGVRVQPV